MRNEQGLRNLLKELLTKGQWQQMLLVIRIAFLTRCHPAIRIRYYIQRAHLLSY
jgi:hypothetical protein